MKILKSIIFVVLSLIAIVILTIGSYLLIEAIQVKIFVPNDYLMWIFKYPFSRLVFIYEIYLFWIFFYIVKNGFRRTLKKITTISRKTFLKKHRRLTIPIFSIVNILLLYTIIFNVTVIQKNRIVDYSFFSPQGKTFSYHDVKKISTGVYGKKKFPYMHSKGDFFYIIELTGGKKIDLTEVGRAKNNVHETFIIHDLDQQFVKMGIPKVSSMKNFEYTTNNLDKIYTDKIREILENTYSKNNN